MDDNVTYEKLSIQKKKIGEQTQVFCPVISWPLRLKVFLFISVILCVVIIVLAQMENVERSVRYHHKSRHSTQRKLQAMSKYVENNNNFLQNTKKTKESLKDIEQSSFVNYSKIVLQLLKENRELQEKFNQTLELLKKCVYTSSSAENLNASRVPQEGVQKTKVNQKENMILQPQVTTSIANASRVPKEGVQKMKVNQKENMILQPQVTTSIANVSVASFGTVTKQLKKKNYANRTTNHAITQHQSSARAAITSSAVDIMTKNASTTKELSLSKNKVKTNPQVYNKTSDDIHNFETSKNNQTLMISFPKSSSNSDSPRNKSIPLSNGYEKQKVHFKSKKKT